MMSITLRNICAISRVICFLSVVGLVAATISELHNRDGLPPFRWCYIDKTCSEPNWSGDCSDKSSYQSPVNLDRWVFKEKLEDEKIVFPKSKFRFSSFGILVKGHTINVKPRVTNPITFKWHNNKDSEDASVYQFDSFHLHWGALDDTGSEHTIHLRSFPAEVHFVFFDKQYGSIDSAHNRRSPFSVISVSIFLDIGLEDGKENFLSTILQHTDNLENGTEKLVSATLELDELFSGTSGYSYLGSYTGPTCRKSFWLVCTKPFAVAKSQLVALRQIMASGTKVLSNNFRSLKETQGRQFYHWEFRYV